ncbi:PucR family transcriptional regulator [Streptomyces sp. B6B3]|uniref:PucR family transcriptional regulator n=1 Tax=Streptomyces sp. B6B3 TaxID=3153570 RepID=UPI00325DFF6B
MTTMLTLRALVEDRALTLSVLVPGPAGALDAEIAWPHTTELPDPSPYLGRRELVLTNGLWHGPPGAAADFVAHVRAAGGAGIVFGLRESVPATPRDLVEECRRAELPLLELSVAVPFTALSQAAAGAYAEDRQNTLVASVRRGNALADAISGGTGADGVLRVLGRDHDLPLAVVDRAGRSLTTTGVELPDADLTAVARALTRRPPPLEVALASKGPAVLFPVGAFGEADAALLCLRPADALDDAERGALEQAAHFLSLEVARRQAVQAIEMRFAGELVDMILSGVGASGELAGRLEAFGIDADGPLAVCALALAEDGATGSPDLAETARQAFVSEGVPAVLATGSRDVVAIFAWRRAAAALPEWAGRLVASLDRRFAGRRTVLGLGGPVVGGTALRNPLMEAREACQVLGRRPTGPSVARFSELPSHTALLGQLDPRDLRRFADALLAPLREHDTARGARLEATLRAFLEHEGQFAAAADALYIHVNTLRKRLSRISELTGRDVLRLEGRVDVFLALRADALARP